MLGGLAGCGSGSPTVAVSRWKAESLITVQSAWLDVPAAVIQPWSLGAFLLLLVLSVCRILKMWCVTSVERCCSSRIDEPVSKREGSRQRTNLPSSVTFREGCCHQKVQASGGLPTTNNLSHASQACPAARASVDSRCKSVDNQG